MASDTGTACYVEGPSRSFERARLLLTRQTSTWHSSGCEDHQYAFGSNAGARSPPHGPYVLIRFAAVQQSQEGTADPAAHAQSPVSARVFLSGHTRVGVYVSRCMSGCACPHMWACMPAHVGGQRACVRRGRFRAASVTADVHANRTTLWWQFAAKHRLFGLRTGRAKGLETSEIAKQTPPVG